MTLRAGMTLVELLVVLALLGMIAGLVGVAPRQSRDVTVPPLASAAREARREALRARKPVRIVVSHSGRSHLVLAMPDGSVIADSALGIERLTGGLNRERP